MRRQRHRPTWPPERREAFARSVIGQAFAEAGRSILDATRDPPSWSDGMRAIAAGIGQLVTAIVEINHDREARADD